MRTSRFVLALCTLLVVSVASARTPSFSETFDDETVTRTLPASFPADLGTVYVSAFEAGIELDPTCDGLSTHALVLNAPLGEQPFEVRFHHDHPAPGGDIHLEAIEQFTLKVGAERTDAYGLKLGFESQGGFQSLPVQFGPARDGDPDPQFGNLYVNGEITDIKYGNVFDSVCSGPDRFDAQVLVTFTMLGEDGQYFIEIQSNAPVPTRERFGPFEIPAAVLAEGYGACMAHGQSGSGRILLDGAECLVASPIEIPPINGETLTHRESVRRTR